MPSSAQRIDEAALNAARLTAAAQPRADYTYTELPLGGNPQANDIVAIWRNGQLYQMNVSAIGGGGGGAFFPVEELTNFVQQGGASTVGQALVYLGGETWGNGIPKLGLQNLNDTAGIGGATAGEVLTFNGTNWVPAAVDVGGDWVGVTWNTFRGGGPGGTSATNPSNGIWLVTPGNNTQPLVSLQSLDQPITLAVGSSLEIELAFQIDTFADHGMWVGITNAAATGSILFYMEDSNLVHLITTGNETEPGVTPNNPTTPVVNLKIYRLTADQFTIVLQTGEVFITYNDNDAVLGATSLYFISLGGESIYLYQLRYRISSLN